MGDNSLHGPYKCTSLSSIGAIHCVALSVINLHGFYTDADLVTKQSSCLLLTQSTANLTVVLITKQHATIPLLIL